MKSNRLFYSASRVKGGVNMTVEVKLADDYQNGHIDFSCTATGWVVGKPRNDKYMVCGGCCHEQIIKVFPELKIFCDLHLCDCHGAPMYVSANGLYFLKNSKKSVLMYSDYQFTEEEYNQFKSCVDNEEEFIYFLNKFNIPQRWMQKAQEGIKLLQELTGKEFQDDSVRYHYPTPSQELIKKYELLESQGYFLPEEISKRKQAAFEAVIKKREDDLIEKRNKQIDKINQKLAVDLYILRSGILSDNFIYYDHEQKVVFNWMDYGDKITQEQFVDFINSVDYSQLPEGIKFEIK